MNMTEETKAKLKAALKTWFHKLLHLLWQMLLAIGLLLIMALGGCDNQENDTSEEPLGEAKISVRIKDLTSPMIVAEEEYSLNQGDAFRLQDHVKVIDNMDGEIGFECEGSFDTSKSGQYILLLTATDTAGNESEKNVTIHVKALMPDTSQVITPPLIRQPEVTEVEQPGKPQAEVYSRDYLYTDGYTMSSASESCSSDLHASGRSGRCDPIMNTDGIYIGVHLELY